MLIIYLVLDLKLQLKTASKRQHLIFCLCFKKPNIGKQYFIYYSNFNKDYFFISIGWWYNAKYLPFSTQYILVFFFNFNKICSGNRNCIKLQIQMQITYWMVVVGHRLEIIIDHRLESNASVDAIF